MDLHCKFAVRNRIMVHHSESCGYKLDILSGIFYAHTNSHTAAIPIQLKLFGVDIVLFRDGVWQPSFFKELAYMRNRTM